MKNTNLTYNNNSKQNNVHKIGLMEHIRIEAIRILQYCIEKLKEISDNYYLLITLIVLLFLVIIIFVVLIVKLCSKRRITNNDENASDITFKKFSIEDYKCLGPSSYENTIIGCMNFVYFLDKYNYEPLNELGIPCLKMHIKYYISRGKLSVAIHQCYNVMTLISTKKTNLINNNNNNLLYEFNIKCKLKPTSTNQSYTSPTIKTSDRNPIFNVLFEFDSISYDIIHENDIIMRLSVCRKVAGGNIEKIYAYIDLKNINYTCTKLISTNRIVVLLPKPPIEIKQFKLAHTKMQCKAYAKRVYVCVGIRYIPNFNKLIVGIHSILMNGVDPCKWRTNPYNYISVNLGNSRKKISDKKITPVFRQNSYIILDYYCVFDLIAAYENDYAMIIMLYDTKSKKPISSIEFNNSKMTNSYIKNFWENAKKPPQDTYHLCWIKLNRIAKG